MADGSGGKQKRGFAAMSEEKQREIARKGGEASGGNRGESNRGGSKEQKAAAGRKGGSK